MNVLLCLALTSLYVCFTDACSNGTSNCDPVGGNCRSTTSGFLCNCITGFTGDGITCRGKLINFVVAHFQLLKNIR